MNREVTVAQLSIVDGAWQESPDNLAVFGESGRGTLYLLAEVAGEAEGRDALARELIETARRAYAASRGSITLALSQAVRAANLFFHDVNVNTPREARRIGGITAVVLRQDEMFIAQGGPGLTCLVRGSELQRYPDESPWFDPGEMISEFPTFGTVPLGLRRDYTPDLFHVTLQPGDTILLSTRALAHLLTNEELLDTLTRRHPDEIVESLEDLAGAADLSVIAIRLAGEPLPYAPQPPLLSPDIRQERQERAPGVSGEVKPPPTEEELARRHALGEEELARRRAQAEQARVRRTKVIAAILAATAGAMAALAGIFARINWTRLGAVADRAISILLRGIAHVILFSIRAFLPGEPREDKHTPVTPASSSSQTAWRFAALLFPLLLIAAGGAAWLNFRIEVQRVQAAQLSQWVDQANAAIESGKSLAQTDKAAARDAFQKAMSLAQQAQKLSPNHAAARNAYYQAEDSLDALNGISVLMFLPRFASYVDAKSNPSRIVAHWPDVFVLDRGTQRIYRYLVNDDGSGAAPASGDGVILRTGDKVGDRTVGELIDMLWIDAGRLVVIDRSGTFLQYDPVKFAWSARAASDASQWTRVSLASSYIGNLYLLDPSRNQILKYVASADGAWTSSVTYFAPGVNVDLSGAIDLAIDGDVWVLRVDGSLWRFTAGKLADFIPRDLDTPLSKPTSLFTSQMLVGVYIADAGNQRIVRLDKVTGKLIRQFRVRSQDRDAFNALKAIAVDETNKKFFFVNGNQAYLATIPQ